ncbi:MAG TPA: hypothetical protein VGN34_07845, partial [Ktedonobacteraceae bacterium]
MQTPSGSFSPQRGNETSSSFVSLLSLQQPRFNRLLGTLIAVMMLALYCVSLPVYFQHLLIVCTTSATCALDGALTPEGLQTLSSWHLSASAYAAYTLIVSSIVFAIWFTIGYVILWRKSDDRMAVLTALFLISFNMSIENGPVSLLLQVYPWWTFPLKLCLSLALVASLLFCYLFPTGRFAPRWTGWCLILGCPFLAVVPGSSPLNATTWP